MKIWIVTGESESLDKYGSIAFTKKPSKSTLSKIAHYWDGDDEKSGGGFDGSYVYIKLESVVVDEYVNKKF